MFSSHQDKQLATLLYLRETLARLEYHCHGMDDDPGEYLSIEIAKADGKELLHYLKMIYPENVLLPEIKIGHDSFGTHFKISETLLNDLNQKIAFNKIELDKIYNSDLAQLSNLLYLRNIFQKLAPFAQHLNGSNPEEVKSYLHLFPGFVSFEEVEENLNRYFLTKENAHHKNSGAANELEFHINTAALRELELKFATYRTELDTELVKKHKLAKPAEKIFNSTPLIGPGSLSEQLVTLQSKIQSLSSEELKSFFITVLRFTPLEACDNLITACLSANLANKEIINKIYIEAKEEFLSKAPYFSRYSSPSELSGLHTSYANDTFTDFKTACENDMKYGTEREALAKGLHAQLLADVNYSPTPGSAFDLLPPSAQGSKKAAALLEKISTWSHAKQHVIELAQAEKIKSPNVCHDFNSLRDSADNITPVKERYAWALPLIEVVSRRSQSADISRPPDCLYQLNYLADNKIIGLNQIKDNPLKKSLVWNHGRAPLSETWGRIESLFETVLSMDLKKPSGSKATEEASYKEKLKDFYSTLAELVWLIGNTQPMKRGSGTFAELILAITHLHHGLQPPILKLDFPQLDVLDITFPLNDYKSFFPYFFEQSTIPEPLRNKDPVISSLPVAAQIEKLYEGLNNKNELAVTPTNQPKPYSTSTATIALKLQAKLQTGQLESASDPSERVKPKVVDSSSNSLATAEATPAKDKSNLPSPN